MTTPSSSPEAYLRVDGVDSLPYEVVGLPGGGSGLAHASSDVLVVS